VTDILNDGLIVQVLFLVGLLDLEGLDRVLGECAECQPGDDLVVGQPAVLVHFVFGVQFVEDLVEVVRNGRVYRLFLDLTN
jgi:hypothetical protein